MMMASRPSLRSPLPPPDMNDIDQFINFDQAAVPSPTFSSAPNRSKSFSAPTSIPNNQVLPTQPSTQLAFAPPSYQYEAYSNHNGLPTGALHEAYSINQIQQPGYGNGQGFFGSSMNNGFGMNNGGDLSFGSGYGTYNNMDVDFDFNSASQNLLTQPVEGLDSSFIDPSAIADPESPQVQQPPKRAYPGMHRQAALEKAQAEQKQKEIEAQRQKERAESTSGSASTRPSAANRPPTDPVVEGKIAQLLNQMRHNSVASSNEDDAATPTASGSTQHGGRTRKDEEDMDEDERLLASEEGKKLSSKERRQLRNKVSARAFRSRRKEYIGQLEGEIATKSAEADELRTKNSALIEENRQLHDLTRTLLASPAFSEFLKEAGGQVLPSTMSTSHTPSVKAESTPTKKDVNPNTGAASNTKSQQQDTPYIGMTMIPEHPVDLNGQDSTNDSWANMDFSLYEASVYAVTSVPEGPSIDQLRSNNVSGKVSDPVLPLPTSSDSKLEPSLPERNPYVRESREQNPELVSLNADADFDESDPAYALFSDCPAPMEAPLPPNDEPIFGHISLEKAFGRVELLIDDESCNTSEVSSTSVERFQRLCSSLEALSERLSSILPEL